MDANTPGPAAASLTWHEAAAVVQQIADQFVAGRLQRVPPAAWITIDERGTASVRSTSNAPARPAPADGKAVAAALADLFHELVGSNLVPAALENALQSVSDGTPESSAQAFSRALAFFVRPSSDRDLVAVAARLQAADEEARLKREMEALVSRAHESSPPGGGPSVGAPVKRRVPRRLLLAVSLFGALLAVLAFALAGARPGGVAFATPVLTQTGTLLKEAKQALLGDKGQPAAPAAAVPAPPSTDRPLRRRDAKSRPTFNASTPLVGKPAPVLPAPALPALTRLLSGLPETIDSANVPEVEPHIFDAAHPEVTPALLVRPHVPTRSFVGIPPGQFGTLEVIVSAAGEVERVRLLGTTVERRYYDGMLLPAVKTWLFRPARLRGLPVRYRLRIVLTN